MHRMPTQPIVPPERARREAEAERDKVKARAENWPAPAIDLRDLSVLVILCLGVVWVIQRVLS